MLLLDLGIQVIQSWLYLKSPFPLRRLISESHANWWQILISPVNNSYLTQSRITLGITAPVFLKETVPAPAEHLQKAAPPDQCVVQAKAGPQVFKPYFSSYTDNNFHDTVLPFSLLALITEAASPFLQPVKTPVLALHNYFVHYHSQFGSPRDDVSK